MHIGILVKMGVVNQNVTMHLGAIVIMIHFLKMQLKKEKILCLKVL